MDQRTQELCDIMLGEGMVSDEFVQLYDRLIVNLRRLNAPDNVDDTVIALMAALTQKPEAQPLVRILSVKDDPDEPDNLMTKPPYGGVPDELTKDDIGAGIRVDGEAATFNGKGPGGRYRVVFPDGSKQLVHKEAVTVSG